MNLITINEMEFSTDNLGKPSNKKFKLISDIALYTLPLYSGAILLLAESSPAFVMWANFIITVAVITLKAISKFTAEPVVELTAKATKK